MNRQVKDRKVTTEANRIDKKNPDKNSKTERETMTDKQIFMLIIEERNIKLPNAMYFFFSFTGNGKREKKADS